jgi:hypothetical protein
MLDFEVERLRHLRGTALRVRAVARALGSQESVLDDALVARGSCAAWRVARSVSGRLRAHPYASFQKDAGFVTLLANSVAARAATFGASTRTHAYRVFEAQLKTLLRELDDTRSLTRVADLSDAFGRSQGEIRSLIAELQRAPGGVSPLARIAREPLHRHAGGLKTAHAAARSAKEDWPYLAF